MPTLSEFKHDFDSFIKQTAEEEERVVITLPNNKKVALVSIGDLEAIEYIEDKIDREEAQNILASMKDDDMIPIEDVMKELKLHDIQS